MTKKMREVLNRLREAETRVQAALENEDTAAAEAAMEEVRVLRAQKAALAREEQEARAAAVANGRRVYPDPADELGGGAGRRGGAFARTVLAQGFDPRTRPVVRVPLAQAFPDPDKWRRIYPDDIEPMGRDERFLFPLLPALDIEDAAAIEDYRQTERAVTGNVERAVDADTDKATLNVKIEHVVREAKQFAVVVPDIPNQALRSLPQLETFLETEGRFVVAQAIDQHVLREILAENPPTSYMGANLIERVRHAIAAMRAVGAQPDVLVLNPTDAAELDLFRQPGTQDYLFPTRSVGEASPLWGLRVVERTSPTGDEPPILLDTRRIGVWYRGMLEVAADPFTGFKKNLTNLRFEITGLFHVRNPKAAHVIAETDGE